MTAMAFSAKRAAATIVGVFLVAGACVAMAGPGVLNGLRERRLMDGMDECMMPYEPAFNMMCGSMGASGPGPYSPEACTYMFSTFPGKTAEDVAEFCMPAPGEDMAMIQYICGGGYGKMMDKKCYCYDEPCEVTGTVYAECTTCQVYKASKGEDYAPTCPDKSAKMAEEEEEPCDEKEEKGPPTCAEFSAVCDAAFPEGTWSAEGCMAAFEAMGKESEDCAAYCAPSEKMGGMAKVEALCPMGFKAALLMMEVPEAYIEECDYALPDR